MKDKIIEIVLFCTGLAVAVAVNALLSYWLNL